MRRRWVLALLVLAACGPSDGDRVALEGARSTALAFWISAPTSDGVGVPGAHVIDARRDGDCYAVHVGGTAGGPGEIVVLRRPARGEPVLHGWELLGARGDKLSNLDGNDERCGFH